MIGELMSQRDFDVTGNIRVIETLKNQLLRNISMLYDNMLKAPADDQGRAEMLADIILTVYLLSSRLGIDPKDMEERIMQRLRLGLLDDDSPLRNDQADLARHFSDRKLLAGGKRPASERRETK